MVHPVHALMKLNVPNVTARGESKGEGIKRFIPQKLEKWT